MADKGTLFLDELGELPLPAKAKLLRVLQDGLMESIGKAKAHKVDVRIVGATNRDLRKWVRQGKFREDLFIGSTSAKSSFLYPGTGVGQSGRTLPVRKLRKAIMAG